MSRRKSRQGSSITNFSSQPVLIRGASSGIGQQQTCYLAQLGYSVYATTRKDEDLSALGNIENVTLIPLNVCNPDQTRPP